MTFMRRAHRFHSFARNPVLDLNPVGQALGLDPPVVVPVPLIPTPAHPAVHHAGYQNNYQNNVNSHVHHNDYNNNDGDEDNSNHNIINADNGMNINITNMIVAQGDDDDDDDAAEVIELIPMMLTVAVFEYLDDFADMLDIPQNQV
ncbi:hypothetical protein EDD11_006391 [Mortierella claussenii]|nr:hypothetical protein EDD11_006391 [Mortierella claussenii]